MHSAVMRAAWPRVDALERFGSRLPMTGVGPLPDSSRGLALATTRFDAGSAQGLDRSPGRRDELDPVPLADRRHLGQVIRYGADLAIHVFEERGRMSGRRKNQHARRRRRRSLKGVHSVARYVSEVARSDAHRLPVYLEVERSLD